jgi:hypothetical protein
VSVSFDVDGQEVDISLEEMQAVLHTLRELEADADPHVAQAAHDAWARIDRAYLAPAGHVRLAGDERLAVLKAIDRVTSEREAWPGLRELRRAVEHVVSA